ncbi:hypothetical protein F5Y03DRAFT_361560 [Xylaria venustula]|nr:hypothetical protein F5Y03DRAFT_361560 [Xylaria venustula]
MGLLALLIRYVVADRIDDRRGMPLENHRTRDSFFADLDARIKRENNARPLRDLLCRRLHQVNLITPGGNMSIFIYKHT